MPNGRSGTFLFPHAQLRKLLQGIPGENPVGRVFSEDRTVSASDMAQMLGKVGTKDVFVEEHDFSWFIIWLGSEAAELVVIDEQSPLYAELRGFHEPGTYIQSNLGISAY